MLADFWRPLEEAVQGGLELSVVNVIDHLDGALEAMLFPSPVRPQPPRLRCTRHPVPRWSQRLPYRYACNA